MYTLFFSSLHIFSLTTPINNIPSFPHHYRFMTLDILSCVTPPYSSTMACTGHGRRQAPISSQTTSYLHPIAHNLAFFSIHFTQGSYNVLYSQLPTQMGGMAPNQNVDFRQLARTLYGYIDQTLFSWFNTVYSALIPCSADYIPLTWWFCNELSMYTFSYCYVLC